MANSLHDPRYRRLIDLLAQARRDAGLTQRDLAKRVKRQASYIGKLESYQRRLDLIELVDLLDQMDVKPSTFLQNVVADIRKRR